MNISLSHPKWVQAVMLMQPEQNGMPFDDDAAYIKASSSDTTTNTSQETQEPQEPSTEIEDYFLDMTKEIVPPDFRFKFGAVGLCPSKAITAVSGQAKQGKTQFLLLLAATALSGRDFGNLKRAKACHSLLWIDTEQNEYNVQNNMKRLYQLADIPEYTDAANIGLYVALLRKCTPLQRVAIISNGMEKYKPDFLIIDGIRDLLHNFNDESESNDIIQFLLTLCEDYPQTNVVCVLHDNPSDNKMRGHLGTELLNKCNDHFRVSKDKGFFRVKHAAGRDIETQGDITFRINERGQLEPFDEFSFIQEQKPKKMEPADIIRSIYAASGTNEMSFSELASKYAALTGKKCDKTAKNAIVSCNEKHNGELLQKLANGNYKLSV